MPAKHFLVSGLIALLAACGAKAAPAVRDWNQPAPTVKAAAPFASPGERVRYRITAYDVELAQMVLAVGEVSEIEGKRALVLQAQAQSTGIAARLKPISMELTSWLDVVTGAPILFRAIESAGKDDPKREQDEVRFAQAANGMLPIVVSRPDEPEIPEKTEQQKITSPPLEILGVLLALRAWDGKEGEAKTFDAMRSQFMWRMQATLAGREVLPTELGELPTVKFEAQSRRLMRDGTLDAGTEPRKFTIWISDDADRVPLLIVAETDYGNVRIDIVDYAAGTAPNLARP